MDCDRSTDKASLGITGLSLPRVTSTEWFGTDVGSSSWAVVGPKGWAVRPLKRYASWVQKSRQFGPYPAGVDTRGAALVREDRDDELGVSVAPPGAWQSSRLKDKR